MRLSEIKPDPFEKGKEYVERLLRLTSNQDQVIMGDFHGTPVIVYYGDLLTVAYNRMKQLYYERVTAYRNTDEGLPTVDVDIKHTQESVGKLLEDAFGGFSKETDNA